MFRGNHPARVDDKGRLKVPTEFKRVWDEQQVTKFFITSKDGTRAEIYPMKTWEEIEASLAKMASSDAKKKFLDVTNYYGQVVEMDSQGRLLLPQVLREKANLAGDMAVLGLQTYLAVVNDGRHQAALEERPLTGADLDSLGLVGV